MDGGRVLVLGATGMLGHACVDAFQRSCEVHATVRDPGAPATHLDARRHRFDVWSDSVADIVEEVRPDVVINAIGLVKQHSEASRPRAAIRINALFPHELAEACSPIGARLIHVSTDCVFSGKQPLGSTYAEDSPPDPIDLYGESKLLGEVPAPALTIRTSIIGRELGRHLGLLEWFLTQEGRTVAGYTRAIFSGLTTGALAEILVAVSGQHVGLAGLYHVASKPISKYDLLRSLREVFALDCSIEPTVEPVINRALDGRRFAAATGLAVPEWRDMLLAYKGGDTDVHAA